MTVATLQSISLALATFQALMVGRNLRLYLPPDEVTSPAPPLSVLVPARDEEERLPGLLQSLSLQRGLPFEVVLLDDDSSDGTLAVAQAGAARDPRFRVLCGRPLPGGWTGKQHACFQLAQAARHEQWLFLDADVRLTDPYALARISGLLAINPAAMQSGIPLQRTDGWAEQLIIPLIHLVLLGFLPFWEMRRNRLPALGAACGQMVAVKAGAYWIVDGHRAVKHRLHDATALAAHFRRNGYLTDLFDATPLAECRMYERAWDVFSGFAKNATEGMARPLALPIWTILLLGANVLPWVLAAWGQWGMEVAAALGLDLIVYLSLMTRFRQNAMGTLSRPLGVGVFIIIQWAALVGKWLGFRSRWKGRSYARAHN